MFDTENSGSNHHHRHVRKPNIIMGKSNTGLKYMNTRLSKNQQRQRNRKWSIAEHEQMQPKPEEGKTEQKRKQLEASRLQLEASQKQLEASRKQLEAAGGASVTPSASASSSPEHQHEQRSPHP